jgi:hypothetical protein
VNYFYLSPIAQLAEQNTPRKLPVIEYKSKGIVQPMCLACLSKEHLIDLGKFLAEKDNGSIGSYITTGKCLPVEEGSEVTVMINQGIPEQYIIFTYHGSKLWTWRDKAALK